MFFRVCNGERLLQSSQKIFRCHSVIFGACFVVSAVASIVLDNISMPLTLSVSILIKIDSRGPVIFRQKRIGRNGKVFEIYKFRSMCVGAEKTGSGVYSGKGDARVTRIGKILRATSIDELPQLLNILKGEMSFVGPRPERKYFYEQFEKYIIGFSNRLVVMPGLTGYAQVNGGYELTPEEKIVYDMEYIARRSIRLDLQCIVKTALLIFTHDGAR